jgi:hypothetical protein
LLGHQTGIYATPPRSPNPIHATRRRGLHKPSHLRVSVPDSIQRACRTARTPATMLQASRPFPAFLLLNPLRSRPRLTHLCDVKTTGGVSIHLAPSSERRVAHRVTKTWYVFPPLLLAICHIRDTYPAGSTPYFPFKWTIHNFLYHVCWAGLSNRVDLLDHINGTTFQTIFEVERLPSNYNSLKGGISWPHQSRSTVSLPNGRS